MRDERVRDERVRDERVRCAFWNPPGDLFVHTKHYTNAQLLSQWEMGKWEKKRKCRLKKRGGVCDGVATGLLKMRKYKDGLHGECGYDLRATPDR